MTVGNSKMVLAAFVAAAMFTVACDMMQPEARDDTIQRPEELQRLSVIPDVKRGLRIEADVPVEIKITASVPTQQRPLEVEGIVDLRERVIGPKTRWGGFTGNAPQIAVVPQDEDPRCSYEDGMSGVAVEEFVDCVNEASDDDDCDMRFEFHFVSDGEGGFDLDEIHLFCGFA